MESDLCQEDPKHKRLAITADGDVVGMLSWYEEVSYTVRYAGMNIFVDPKFHRSGYATDALRTLGKYLLGPGGHHRLVIDPHVVNTAAVACYEKVGFRPVGVMRKYISVRGGPLEDALLMDLLAEDAKFL
jgi:aminoglycoside 6'-N-acetyltransferase